jgi:hypothetical protein
LTAGASLATAHRRALASCATLTALSAAHRAGKAGCFCAFHSFFKGGKLLVDSFYCHINRCDIQTATPTAHRSPASSTCGSTRGSALALACLALSRLALASRGLSLCEEGGY